MKNKMNNNKKLECGSCGTALKLESPPDGVIIFSCEECGSKVSWKISNLTNKIDKRHISDESTGIAFTKIEKSIVKTTVIIIILLSVLLLFYVFIKKGAY